MLESTARFASGGGPADGASVLWLVVEVSPDVELGGSVGRVDAAAAVVGARGAAEDTGACVCVDAAVELWADAAPPG
ncbi:MAG: hypothetical protein J2P51_16160 [Hyphomicrobiaceae bacterium]|nr:hypothetical protein [Hyphomicrobiaceae bacterium]